MSANPATSLYSTAQLRELEAAHPPKSASSSLMHRAGLAVVRHALEMLKPRKAANILVLAGPGNNGGDAWVAAAALLKARNRVTVIALGEQKFAEPAARSAHAAYLKAGGEVRKDLPRQVAFDLVIDGLFGIGITRPTTGAFASTIAAINDLHARQQVMVLAIDLPSGLIADTGVAPSDTIVADRTVTFLALKPGLFTGDGRDHAGEVFLETLGVSSPEPTGQLLTADTVRALIPARRHQSHKGTFGSVGIIGGTDGMIGAAVLAARAALYMGPGKVFLGLAAKDMPAFDPLNPEVMLRRADDLVADNNLTAIAIGMGLGTERTAPRLVSAALSRGLPTVLDADALNLLASTPSLANLLGTGGAKSSMGAPSRAKKPETPRQCLRLVLAPHPGEAARLLNVATADVQADRIAAAVTLAQRFQAVVVLKGSGTVVAEPDGRYAINTSGNPGMASGGMGDALSGMIASLLAQGLNAADAARLAVYLHGAAADACMEHGMAPHGLTASEVIFEARSLLNAGLEGHAH